MSAPYYFIADAKVNFAEVFNARLGDPVAHALEWWGRHGLAAIVSNNGGRISASASNGPDNTSGVWVTVWPETGSSPKPLGFFPDRQTWTKVREATESSPAIYVGHTKGQKPTPEDLTNGNPHNLPGSPLRLCDQNTWNVPEIREPVHGGDLLPTPVQHTGLPKLVRRGLDGRLINPVKEEFAAIWEASGRWFDIWCELHFTDRDSFNSEAALEYCMRVLQLRYRICDLTNDAFGLLDTSNFQDIIATSIGWAPVLQLLEERLDMDTEKKNQDSAIDGSVNGSSGLEDSGHSTGPPAENNG